MKKIILILISLILSVTLVGGIVWFGLNAKAIFSKTKLVPQSQVEEAYNNGYNDAKKDDQSGAVIENLNKQIEELNKNLSTLTEENNRNKEELEKALTDKSVDAETIKALQKNYDDSNAKVIGLQAEVERLNQLIVAYEEYAKTTFTVEYYVDADLWSMKVVKTEELIPQMVASKLGNRLLGWSLTKGSDELIDTSTYAVTENIKVYAVFEINIDGKYKVCCPDLFYTDGNPLNFIIENNQLMSCVWGNGNIVENVILENGILSLTVPNPTSNPNHFRFEYSAEANTFICTDFSNFATAVWVLRI